MSVKIAVVQQERTCLDVGINRQKALHFVAEALKQKPDIVLLQEALLVDIDQPDCRQNAEPVDGPTTRAFQSILKGTDTLVLYGLVERDGDKLYLSAPCLAADRIIANYRKTHLWWKYSREALDFTPGDRWVTFDLKDHKSGIMICYDGDFPETARSYANLGCTMLFWMNKRDSRGHEETEDGSIIKHMAKNNSIIMAASCGCRQVESGGFYGGGSNITNHRGELLAEIWGAEGVIYAEVHPELVQRDREANPWFRGQRQDLYNH